MDTDKNQQLTSPELLNAVRQAKMAGKADAQIAEMLSSTHGPEEVQKALGALSYMQVSGTQESNPVGVTERAAESNQKRYSQQALHVIIVFVCYEVMNFFVGFVLRLILWAGHPKLLTTGEGFETAPTPVGAAIVTVLVAAVTYLLLRKRFGLTAFTVLFTIAILQIYTYVRYAIYFAQH